MIEGTYHRFGERRNQGAPACEKEMTGKTIPAVGAACVAAFFLCFLSCNSPSPEARAAAVQFASSWEQTIRVLGLLDLSDLNAVEAQARNLDPQRLALRSA